MGLHTILIMMASLGFSVGGVCHRRGLKVLQRAAMEGIIVINASVLVLWFYGCSLQIAFVIAMLVPVTAEVVLRMPIEYRQLRFRRLD